MYTLTVLNDIKQVLVKILTPNNNKQYQKQMDINKTKKHAGSKTIMNFDIKNCFVVLENVHIYCYNLHSDMAVK